MNPKDVLDELCVFIPVHSVWREPRLAGDVVNVDAPSIIKGDEVIRVKKQFVAEDVTVRFVIRDEDASLSTTNIIKLYIEPAATHLHETINGRTIVPQMNLGPYSGKLMLDKENIRLFSEYDHQMQGTEFKFVVRVLTPRETPEEVLDRICDELEDMPMRGQ